ncbi:MAG: sulfatase-like hydrolase/transferase [Planctomycetota bacterium]
MGRSKPASLACGLLVAGAAAAQPAPNVVFILADDLGIGDIGPYGQQTIQTPSLDAMAAGGMTFTNMYSGAPVCSPARATLFTGLHNGRFNNGNGVAINGETTTTADVFRSGGYATGLFGKLHLGGPNPMSGFDEFYGIRDGVAAWDHFSPFMERGVADVNGNISSISQEANNGGYTDDLVAAESIQFIRDQAQANEPFYTQLNFQIAHFDLEVPELEPYTEALDVPEQEKIHASMVTRMDRHIGSLMDALRDPNGDGDTSDSIADNTLVVFASDNGAAIEGSDPARGTGPHDPETFDSNGVSRGWKRDLYDGGIKTPFIAHWAGTIEAGSTSDRLGSFSDFLPTAAELIGTTAPVGIDGESYADVLTGAPKALPGTRRDQYFEFTGGSFVNGANGDFVRPSTDSPARWALIRDGFKAIYFNDGTIELYDLANDPSESNNLYPSNSSLAIDMILTAIDQDTGPIQYARFNTDGGAFFDLENAWNTGSVPGTNAVATVRHEGAGTADVFVSGASASLLALDVGGGAGGTQLVAQASTLTAANGVRVNAGSTLRVEDVTVTTLREVENFGGRIEGRGTVIGQLINAGTVAPDNRSTTPPPRPVSPDAIDFDFSGVQDDAPLTQTSFLNSNLQLVSGFDFGPGTFPRGAGANTDRGNEFNVSGFNAGSLSGAVALNDYLTFTVAPVDGVEMIVDSISFDLWRNGGNAANDYAILTSLAGFQAGQELGQLNGVFGTGPGSQQRFTAFDTSGTATTDPLEVRLYGWNANDGLANTHITGVSLDATFVSLSATAAAAVAPGADAFGTLTLDGNYQQTDEGRLEIQWAQPGEHDLLSITGTAVLDGQLGLQATLATPAAYESFALLTAQEVVGRFAEIDGVEIDGSLAWAVTYSDTEVTATAAQWGDADLDGFVGQTDLNTVLLNWGQTDGTWATGDFTGDGFVSQFDLNHVLLNWGDQVALPAETQNVPEPGVAAGLVGMSLTLLRRGGR